MPDQKKNILSTPMTRAEALRSMAAGVVAGAFGLSACSEPKRTEQVTIAGKDGRVSLKRNPRNGDEVSLLGFGCMRFPTVGGDRYTGRIDREPTREMLEYAYQRGVNYYDTAWMYHRGDSEGMVGEVLKQYPRDSFFLADKMPPETKTLEQAKEIFATQLQRCGVEYFDYYLCHSISRQYVFQNLYLNQGVLEYLLEEKRRGRIRRRQRGVKQRIFLCRRAAFIGDILAQDDGVIAERDIEDLAHRIFVSKDDALRAARILHRAGDRQLRMPGVLAHAQRALCFAHDRL